VRPRKLVAGAVLTTALALVALPGLTSSRSPSSDRSIDPAALQPVSYPSRATQTTRFAALDPAFRSAGFVAPGDVFVEPPAEGGPIPARPDVDQPGSRSYSAMVPPRYTLTGFASFYDHGTTAMRLPRGTLVVICGDGGCIERRVTDYGPNARIHPDRIADLFRPDFFRICGCPSFAGTTRVTIKVY